MIVSLLLAISYPTLAVAPHMFVNAYNNVATAYSFPQAQKVKEYLYLKELFGCLASGKYSFKSASHPNRPEPLKELKFCRPGLLKKTVVPEKTLKPQQADTTLRKKNNEK